MAKELQGKEFLDHVRKMRDAVDSPWLSVRDIEDAGDVKVVIESVERFENVEFEQGRKKAVCYALKFAGKERRLLLGREKQDQIVRRLGKHTKDWVGKEITLYVDPNVKVKGVAVGGVRIR